MPLKSCSIPLNIEGVQESGPVLGVYCTAVGFGLVCPAAWCDWEMELCYWKQSAGTVVESESEAEQPFFTENLEL